MPTPTKNPSDNPRDEKPKDPEERDSAVVSGEIELDDDDERDFEIDEDDIEEIDLDDLAAMEGPDT